MSADDGLDFIIGDVVRHLDDKQVFDLADAIRAAGYVQVTTIDVVFDGPPGHDGGRFVEVEDVHGRSVGVGEWIDRGDGFWALRISASRPAVTDETSLRALVTAAVEDVMPAETVHTRDWGQVGIAPDIGDLVDAVVNALRSERGAS